MTEVNEFSETKKSTNKPFYFSSWYSDDAKPANLDEFSSTAKLHVNKIKESDSSSVLDIGCGAGGILLALQNSGINEIHGVEASEDALKLAKKRFEKYGKLEEANFLHGNAVDLDLPSVNAVSLHRVICCYPDVKSLLAKATENNPKLLVFTIPPRNIISQFITLIENLLLRIVAIFKPSLRGLGNYVHSMTLIDEELQKRGYSQTFVRKKLIWQTYVYEKN